MEKMGGVGLQEIPGFSGKMIASHHLLLGIALNVLWTIIIMKTGW